MSLPSSIAGGGLAGSAGAITAWLLKPVGDGSPLIATIVITVIACGFGMVSSISRIAAAEKKNAGRSLALNAGGVWIAALALALQFKTSLPMSALIGLGVGLAGSTILAIVEAGAIALAKRVLGEQQIVVREELDEKVGEVRQQAQLAVAEQVVKLRDAVPPPRDTGELWGDPDL